MLRWCLRLARCLTAVFTVLCFDYSAAEEPTRNVLPVADCHCVQGVGPVSTRITWRFVAAGAPSASVGIWTPTFGGAMRSDRQPVEER